jgi:hypothetical protein
VPPLLVVPLLIFQSIAYSGIVPASWYRSSRSPHVAPGSFVIVPLRSSHGDHRLQKPSLIQNESGEYVPPASPYPEAIVAVLKWGA